MARARADASPVGVPLHWVCLSSACRFGRRTRARATGSAESTSGRPGAGFADVVPEDRALLARHHLAGLDPEELARRPFRPVSLLRERLACLSARIAGPVPPGVGPDAIRTRARTRLRVYADIPVSPVNADLAAKRARAEASSEQDRLLLVAICAALGLLVALAPNLVRLVNR